jgi:hypothetical protein
MLRRQDIPQLVSRLLDDRPVRWMPPERAIGDFDGRTRALEVFNADPGEQRALLRRLRHDRPAIEQAAGGPVLVIFHTSSETHRLYSDVMAASDPARVEPRFLQLDATYTRWLDNDMHEGQIGPQRRTAA